MTFISLFYIYAFLYISLFYISVCHRDIIWPSAHLVKFSLVNFPALKVQFPKLLPQHFGICRWMCNKKRVLKKFPRSKQKLKKFEISTMHLKFLLLKWRLISFSSPRNNKVAPLIPLEGPLGAIFAYTSNFHFRAKSYQRWP